MKKPIMDREWSGYGNHYAKNQLMQLIIKLKIAPRYEMLDWRRYEQL